MRSMEAELESAALSGNVRILEHKLAYCRSNNDYSCLFSRSTTQEEAIGNIFHLAAWNLQEIFIEKAIRLIPNDVIRSLVSYQEPHGPNPGYNPLHVAAHVGHPRIVQMFRGLCTSLNGGNSLSSSDNYNNSSPEYSRPWLAKDYSKESTPLHVALREEKEDCALEILSFDMESLCDIDDKFHNSPLFLAFQKGHTRVVDRIMTSNHTYSVSGQDGFTPLHFSLSCSEDVCKRLIGGYPQMIKQADRLDKSTILHQWVKLGNVSMFKHLVESPEINEENTRNLVDLIRMCDRHGNNPFHIAVERTMEDASKTLANIYKKSREDQALGSVGPEPLPPWLTPNNSSRTPLQLALNYDHDALQWLRTTFGENSHNCDVEPLFLAVRNGHHQVAQQIWNAQLRFGWSPICRGGQRIWEVALNHSEEVAKWFANRLPQMCSNGEAVDALVEASQKGYDWLVAPMLLKHPSALEDRPLAWVEACREGHYKTVVAFIDNYHSFRELCLRQRITPLHRIKFQGYEQYRQFLEHPVMKGLRNYQDIDGATPLHQAIRDENIELTEMLLTLDDVSRSLKDKKEHKTPMDLLDDVCRHRDHQDWRDMCRRIGIIPGLKTTYFQDRTNLYEVRNTLSVVAALLATITFTAGFTLPGGLDGNTGEAQLAKSPAFLVFLLSDGFAMCCSMLMLVCLVWSMVCDQNKSLILIDHSMPILLMALCSTLVAFMSGVYVVIQPKCPWAAIVILVMCSIFIFSANKTIMDVFLDIFSPATDREYRDLEQGMANTTQQGRNSWVHRRGLRSFRGRTSDHHHTA